MSLNLTNISINSNSLNGKTKCHGNALIKEKGPGLGYYILVLKTEKKDEFSPIEISKEYPSPRHGYSTELFLERTNDLLKTNNYYLAEVSELFAKGFIEKRRTIKGKLYSVINQDSK